MKFYKKLKQPTLCLPVTMNFNWTIQFIVVRMEFQFRVETDTICVSLSPHLTSDISLNRLVGTHRSRKPFPFWNYFFDFRNKVNCLKFVKCGDD